MNKVYLLLGSNLGNSRKQLEKATQAITKKIGSVKRGSSVYRTAAWGKTDQPDFLNQVIIIETKLTPTQTMQTILEIEKEMGRVRTEKNAPRVIDIDILYFNKAIISEPNLEVPHPFLHVRRFVLVPLNELAPNFIHPVLRQTNHQLLLTCPDQSGVKKN